MEYKIEELEHLINDSKIWDVSPESRENTNEYHRVQSLILCYFQQKISTYNFQNYGFELVKIMKHCMDNHDNKSYFTHYLLKTWSESKKHFSETNKEISLDPSIIDDTYNPDNPHGSDEKVDNRTMYYHQFESLLDQIDKCYNAIRTLKYTEEGIQKFECTNKKSIIPDKEKLAIVLTNEFSLPITLLSLYSDEWNLLLKYFQNKSFFHAETYKNVIAIGEAYKKCEIANNLNITPANISRAFNKFSKYFERATEINLSEILKKLNEVIKLCADEINRLRDQLTNEPKTNTDIDDDNGEILDDK